MNVWFVRSNGKSGHGDPKNPALYVPGQPANPTYNYRLECLSKGYARIGWPASGDLRIPGWRAIAQRAYGLRPGDPVLNYLEDFSSIKLGDLVLIPADGEIHEVHLGFARSERHDGDSHPYYYHHDAQAGDWYENAHRVSVSWCKFSDGNWAKVKLPGLGGPWAHAFSPVKAGKNAALDAARNLLRANPQMKPLDVRTTESADSQKLKEALLDGYQKSGREVGYWAFRYLQALRRDGGLTTAKRLLRGNDVSVGFTKLLDAGRLDLTVEHIVLKEEFRHLFSSEELDEARRRLETHGDVAGPRRRISADYNFPDELPDGRIYTEGSVRTVITNVYERDRGARAACLKKHGRSCKACGLNFEKRYGEIGKDFIHVHHKKCHVPGIRTPYGPT